jgi:hypothetical protein
MIPSIKLSEYLYEIATGEHRVASEHRGREREKESDRSAEWEMKRWQKWKWCELEMGVSKKGHLSICSNKSIDSIGCQSKRDKSWVDLKFFRFTCVSTFVLMMTCFNTVTCPPVEGQARSLTLEWSPVRLACEYHTRVEVTDREGHSGLLRQWNNYSPKSFMVQTLCLNVIIFFFFANMAADK